MSLKINKNKNKNKNKTTKVNRNVKTSPNKTTQKFSYYDKYFTNTPIIPSTQITNYMKKYYKNFKKIYDYYENKKGDEIINPITDPNSYFDFGVIKEHPGAKRVSFDTPIYGNPDMSLDKLIANAFYIKSRSAFENNEYLETLKYQLGKDLGRGDRTINGIHYNKSYFSDNTKNYYQYSDIFYKILISFFQSNGGIIDYNTINKIALLSCQNMHNFITDIVTIKLKQLLNPEDNAIFSHTKSEKITILPKQKTIEFFFNSQLIISRDRLNGQFMDPEYPCGNLEFILLFDFDNNTFRFTKFKLDYDLNKCGPESNFSDNTTNNKNIDVKYAIPVSLGVTGLATIPFILGALGGKRKTRKIRKTRNNKLKKSKKTYNY